MPFYTVAWEVQGIEADSPEEAALEAQKLVAEQIATPSFHSQWDVTRWDMSNPESEYTCVDICGGKASRIDLEPFTHPAPPSKPVD
jgi:hypothetical protein